MWEVVGEPLEALSGGNMWAENTGHSSSFNPLVLIKKEREISEINFNYVF